MISSHRVSRITNS